MPGVRIVAVGLLTQHDLNVLGASIGWTIPLWLGLALAAGAFVIGELSVHEEAEERRLLMRHTLERMIPAGMPCYLDSADERNLPFYKRLGFRVVESGTVPGSQLRTWARGGGGAGAARRRWNRSSSASSMSYTEPRLTASSEPSRTQR